MNIIKKIKIAKIVIRDLTAHPLNQQNKLAAVWRLIKWQIRIKFNTRPFIHPFTEKAKLIINAGMPAATGQFI